ncbi:MAG: GNAT family N-acetyltransferase [Oscillospiraceae bacterium]|nr:GNAT family N-acetyltransferase [Oscillospiraceae bacterium]
MENLVIRKAEIQDLMNVQSLSQELMEYEVANLDNGILDLDWSLNDKGKEYFENQILSNIVYVAQIDDKCIGYISGNLNENEPWYNVQIAYIYNLYVVETYRSNGIGKLLIDEFRKSCLSKDIHHINVTTLSNNDKAIKFYNKYNFKTYNTQLICID